MLQHAVLFHNNISFYMRNDEKNSFFNCNSFKEVLILFYFFIN